MILDRKDRKKRIRMTNVPVKSEARVRSSNGHISIRVRVTTTVKLGKELLQNVDFTLATRANMLCPVLLGRDAVKKRFVVDTHKKFVLSRNLKTRVRHVAECANCDDAVIITGDSNGTNSDGSSSSESHTVSETPNHHHHHHAKKKKKATTLQKSVEEVKVK